MVQRFLKIIIFSIILINNDSCRINPKNKLLAEKINEFPQLNIKDISWGDCMRYGEPYNNNDSLIIIDGLGINKESRKYKSKYYKKIYVKNNCEYNITFQEKAINGTYRINDINPYVDEKNIIGYYYPDYFIANFVNGKRDGQWEYFSSLSYRPYSPNLPIKIEIYKEGLPNGEWWQKSKDRIEYFTYKNGILINHSSR